LGFCRVTFGKIDLTSNFDPDPDNGVGNYNDHDKGLDDAVSGEESWKE